MTSDLPIKAFASPRKWEQWLGKHYGDQAGIWIKFAKKASGIPSVTYTEALEIALCYGWIDGQALSYDETYYLQRFTPRRPKSVWSKINIGKVEKLAAAGKMKPSGLAAVQAAKDDGRWAAAYDPPSAVVMPDDFRAALVKNPKAHIFYKTLNKTNTFSMLWRIQTAKKPETRRARIEKFIAMLEKGEKLH